MIPVARPRVCTVTGEVRDLGQPTYIKLSLRLDRGTQTIIRSYDELRRLESGVAPVWTCSALPPRKSIETTLSPSARSKRNTAIEDFLSSILSHGPEIADFPAVKEFLGPHISEHLKLGLSFTEPDFEFETPFKKMLTAVVEEVFLPSTGSWVAHHVAAFEGSDTASTENLSEIRQKDQVPPLENKKDQADEIPTASRSMDELPEFFDEAPTPSACEVMEKCPNSKFDVYLHSSDKLQESTSDPSLRSDWWKVMGA